MPMTGRGSQVARAGAGRRLGFGYGEHVCLGQRRAELQLRVAYEEMFVRLKDLKLVGPPRRLRANLINGIKPLLVTFGAF